MPVQVRAHRLTAAVPSLVVSIAAACGGLDRGDYVSRNLELLRSIPQPANTRVVRTQHLEYHADSGHEVIEGYTTFRIYRVPAEATAADLAMFYRRALDKRWREAHPLEFHCGRAALWVDLSELASRTLVVRVDHDFRDGRVPCAPG